MRVLLATDGSPASEVALELVASVAWPRGTIIRLLMAIEPVDAVLSGAWAPAVAYDLDRQEVELIAAADAVLAHAARGLATSGADIEQVVVRGRPATAIVDSAAELPADLIVLGSRGHGTISSMVLGSVSAEVADHAPCPVLVARSPRVTRVVLGVDGSTYAQAAEEYLGKWPIFSHAAIEATSVAHTSLATSSGLALSGYAPSTDDFTEIGKQVVGDHQRLADEAAERLKRAGLRASARVIEGDAASELIRVARDDQADLIVVGTHGRTGLSRLVLGSVARRVMVHAGCSVLVVRPPG